MMRGLRQYVCLTLALGCGLGAIVACQGSPNPSEVVDTTADSSAGSNPPDGIDEGAETTQPPQTLSSSSAAPEDNTTAAPANTGVSNTTGSETAVALAPVPPLPPECTNPPDQQSMNLCAKATYNQADVELNNASQAIKATLATQRAAELQAAEQAWIAFRDLYCEFVQSQFEGGSIQPMVYHGCLTLLTQDRTDELQQADGTPLSYDAADAELNAIYQDLQTYLTPAEQALLTDAQVAWLDYRDLHCEFETADTNTCLASVTETRTNQLKEQVDSRSR